MKKNKIPQKQYIKDHNTTLADLLPSFGEISA